MARDGPWPPLIASSRQDAPAWTTPLRPRDGSFLIGIVGGMGPLASAAFVQTIYESGIEREQDAPRLILYSDPGVPDRTEAFLAGEEREILDWLTVALAELQRFGATAFVLCCMTVHHLLPRLDAALRERIVSLVDVLVEQLSAVSAPLLMLCSAGTRELRLFERHPRWSRVRDRVIMPDESDQQMIHRDMIFRLKRGALDQASYDLLTELIARYDASGFIVGCSEIHILAKHHRQLHTADIRSICVDPLEAIAQEIRTQQAHWRARSGHSTPANLPHTSLPVTGEECAG